MKATVNITTFLRAAMTLLAVVFTTITTWAQTVTIQTAIESNGILSINGSCGSVYEESDDEHSSPITTLSYNEDVDEDDEVTLTAVAKQGYQFKEWLCVDNETNKFVEAFESPTSETTTFTFGENDMTVTAVFERTGADHIVSFVQSPNAAGTVQGSIDNLTWNSPLIVDESYNGFVYLSATPKDGYTFVGYVVRTSDGVFVPVSNNSFVMPNDNVTVMAVFRKTDEPGLGSQICSQGGGTVVCDGSKVYAIPNEGYFVLSVFYSTGSPDSSEPQSSSELVSVNESYYMAPSANSGYVTVTFAEATEDVLVVFNMNGYGGQAPADQELKIGEKATRPTTDPTDDNVVFLGWYKSNSPSVPYNFDTKLSKLLPYDTTRKKYVLKLYAKWLVIAGNCGKKDDSHDGTQLTWRMSKSEGSDEYSVLTISGNGEMEKYSSKKAPWYDYRNTIKTVIIEKGVESISDKAFYNYPALTTVTIGSGAIGKSAFMNCPKLATITIGSGVTSIGNNAFCAISPTKDEAREVTFAYDNAQLTTIGNFAFRKCKIKSDMILPASVTTINSSAFADVQGSDGTSISLSQGSQLATIGKNAFKNVNMNIDLRNADRITKLLYKNPKNVFDKASGDVTLPVSLTLIEAKKNGINTTFDGYKGNHVYFPVPDGKFFYVNYTAYTGELNNGMADIVGYLFPKGNRKKSSGVSLLLTQDDSYKYNITTDDICEAYHYGEYVGYGGEAENALVGETVEVSWDGEHVPAGYYVSDITVTKQNGGTIKANSNDDNSDYWFVMPDDHVTITSVLSPQVEYTLDFTDKTTKRLEIPDEMFILMNTLLGYYGCNIDPDTGEAMYFVDLNRDGTPDLQLICPEADDDDETTPDSNETTADSNNGKKSNVYVYYVKRLKGADEVTKNYHFTPVYPIPYKYNKIFVKLNNEYEEVEQPLLEDFDDDTDNAVTIADWAGDGKTHNVMIGRRTLYRDGYWNTLCLPFDATISGSPLDLDGVEARQLSSATITEETAGATLNLTFSTPVTTLSAGVPYIIKWAPAAQNIVDPLFMNVTIPDMGITDADRADKNCYALMGAKLDAFLAAKGYDNGQGDKRVRFLGTYKSIRFDTTDKSILLVGANNRLYYPNPTLTDPTQDWSDENPYIYPELHAFRAYFKLGDGTALAPQLTAINLNFDGETTEITTTDFTDYTDSTNAWYDMQGRKLDAQPTQKGLYIHGGRKVVIK